MALRGISEGSRELQDVPGSKGVSVALSWLFGTSQGVSRSSRDLKGSIGLARSLWALQAFK